ncbi:MAG: hypothetical protein ACRYG7_46070 [Janthinobacterium lividum]
MLVSRIRVHEQARSSRLAGIKAQQPADALGGPTLIAESVPDDAYPQVGDIDALWKPNHGFGLLLVTGKE